MELIDRYQGCLMGLAVGDALGTTLEFKPPGTFEPITDLVGGGPFRLEPGQWTDDTSMALCLATSLVEQVGFDPQDQMLRYVRWWKEGYLSSNGQCFDIGNTVLRALERFQNDGDPFAGSSAPNTAGNGSLMRLAPIPMTYLNRPIQALDYAGWMSMTTHAATEAVDACRLYTGLIMGALLGLPKADILAPDFLEERFDLRSGDLCPAIRIIQSGSYKTKQPPAIRGTGYVVHSLEAALWAFCQSDSFEEGALLAVNLGDDADTTGAIFGQLAGAFYGIKDIPMPWRSRVALSDLILQLSEQLYQRSRNTLSQGSGEQAASDSGNNINNSLA